VILGRFRERFSKGTRFANSWRSPRGPPFRETWIGNPIFWIEVVGGTLDPKNWMKTWCLLRWGLVHVFPRGGGVYLVKN